MYSFRSRVRYSETDSGARLSLTGIMNYLQDCVNFQSEELGVGLEYSERRKKTWLLSAWQIDIKRRPALGEEITVATWPYEFKGIYGLRNFAIYDLDGGFLVKANSYWFLVDTVTGRPQKPTEEDMAPYVTDAPLKMDYASRKIACPAGMAEVGRLRVMKHQIDTNRHVNNAQYVVMARDALPEGMEIASLRTEYRKAAVLGDEIVLKKADVPDGCVVSLRSTEDVIFANVELKAVRPC